MRNTDEDMRMDAEMMSIMVDDYLADHYEEFEDGPLALDGAPYYDAELGEWKQEAHDSEHSYTLVARHGDIIIIS